ncbi:MAG TPA: RNA methyltransferase [Symbiobacteriaceae bacterium]|nr:RNA methyltransferase [Symbiobacteriaceae bacterium]
MTELLSPRNPKVAQARELARDRGAREESGLAVLEGIRLAEEAVAAGVPMEYALYTEELAGKERGAALLRALTAAGVELHPVAAETLARAADTQTPQGILAVFRPRLWQVAEIPTGLTVVLDNLQDPGNLGTVIRSLEALGGAGLVMAGGVDPYNPKVVRSAMGSLFRLPVVKGEIGAVLRALKAQGRKLFVADAGGDLTPWTAGLHGNAVLVIGNEGNGPSDISRQLADGIISIPMPGPTESLNAGVAASLLIYEAMRQRAARPSP